MQADTRLNEGERRQEQTWHKHHSCSNRTFLHTISIATAITIHKSRTVADRKNTWERRIDGKRCCVGGTGQAVCSLYACARQTLPVHLERFGILSPTVVFGPDRHTHTQRFSLTPYIHLIPLFFLLFCSSCSHLFLCFFRFLFSTFASSFLSFFSVFAFVFFNFPSWSLQPAHPGPILFFPIFFYRLDSADLYLRRNFYST